jgi:hypothetical protein
MARQNNFMGIHSSENLAATTSSGATRSSAALVGINYVRISSSGLAYVKLDSATPTSTVASGVAVNVGEPITVVIPTGYKIAAITASGTATVNITWLEG